MNRSAKGASDWAAGTCGGFRRIARGVDDIERDPRKILRELFGFSEHELAEIYL